MQNAPFLLQQRFVKSHVCVAEAVVRARFLKKTGGSVSPFEILQLADLNLKSATLSEWVSKLEPKSDQLRLMKILLFSQILI